MTIKLNDPSLLKTQAFIDGKWVNGDNGDTFAVYNPATGEHLADVASVGAAETRCAIDAAQFAMKSWRQLTAKARSTNKASAFRLS